MKVIKFALSYSTGNSLFIYRGVLAIFFAYLPMSAMLGALNLRTNVVCKWNLCSF
ncbi:hypothetical protein LEP1GSC168_3671 [Leptospira santarosai str. HAI134]|nr:hypothetical protein LEP1GSC163_4241 [Leptospira santarosai str. CBC379]EMJ50457.1 hypothetical protein LEP1GSC169_3058 [Leptospira santarosai str. HAI1349]EMO21283.1 hypothetical protein LEP1GSC168_3671 [Leptospira santarosai str. HAI134]EMP80427.1 hypothetical protein LEP1GSC162_0058 [Leptospira santarosai str. CBC1531]